MSRVIVCWISANGRAQSSLRSVDRLLEAWIRQLLEMPQHPFRDIHGRFRSDIGRNSYHHRFCGATLHDIQVLGCPVAESWNFILAAQVSCWHLTSRHTIAQLRTNEWNPYLNGPELPLCTSQLAGMNGSHWRLQGNELHLSSSSNPIVTPNTAEGQPGGLGPGS
jgi:hypothetical protein